MRKYIIAVILGALTSTGIAQQVYPLNRDMELLLDRELIKKNIPFFSENKPYIDSDLKKNINYESITGYSKRDSVILSRINSRFWSAVWRKIRKESLIKVDSKESSEDIHLTIDPLFNFGKGQFNTSDRSVYKYTSTYFNTRGAIIRGQIGKNVAFFSSLYENQARFIDYIDAGIKSRSVVPGEGIVKDFKGNPYKYDYSSVAGLVSWSPSSHFNLQFGNSKNFIGDGYRSLLLSDNSFNYPFLKVKTTYGRIEYTNIYASYQLAEKDYAYKDMAPFLKKYATMHLLSLNVFKGFNISIFESTIWKAKDGTKSIPFQAKYLNPVIGVQTAGTGLNSNNNSLLGLNVRYKFLNHHMLYGQLVADDINLSDMNHYDNKTGFQLGYKYYDILSVKNLCFQTEYNMVRPYTYSHSNPIQSYSHYNQALAHPLGANFRESVSFLNYRFKDLFAEIRFNYAVYGADDSSFVYGQNIFISPKPDNSNIKSLSDNKIAQGIKNTLTYKAFRLNYLINPATNLNIYIEISDRTQKSDILNYHSTLFSFGIKTSLDNYYYDF